MTKSGLSVRSAVPLWAVAHIFVFTNSWPNWQLWQAMAHIAVMLVVLLFPQRKEVLIAGVLSAVLFHLWKFPLLANHGFLLLGLDLVFLSQILSRTKRSIDLTPLLGLAYLMAGLHKINVEYVYDSASCFFYFFPWLPHHPFWPSASIVFEVALGLGYVIFPFRWKRWLIPISLLFHLSFVHYSLWNFLAVVLVCLFHGRYDDRFAVLRWPLFLHISTWLVEPYLPKGVGGFLLYSTSMLIFLDLLWRERHRLIATRTLKAPFLWTTVTLQALWCFSLYLGLAAYPVYSMFSNLKITDRFSNSYLVPHSWYVDRQPFYELVSLENGNWLYKDWLAANIILGWESKHAVYIPETMLIAFSRVQRDFDILVKHPDTGQSVSFREIVRDRSMPSALELKFNPKKPVVMEACQW